MIAVEIENLTKRYPGKPEPALAGAGLRIEPGEFFGLLGPNGAGKSTLISILSGVCRATSGRVRVGEVDVCKHPARIRSLIGLVPQDLALYADLSVRENLAYFGRMHGLRGEAFEEGLARSLAAAALETQADRRVAHCSGGMKRRLNLAAALIHGPSLLVLDEPTVGVDAQSRGLIFDRLRELNAAGVTVLYTTHYMEEAQRLCHRVAILDAGSVIALGTPDALVAAQDGCTDLETLFLALTGRSLRD